VGQDGVSHAADLPDGESEIFLIQGLTSFLKIGSDLPVRAVLLIALDFFAFVIPAKLDT
jgi:hypothetical protein